MSATYHNEQHARTQHKGVLGRGALRLHQPVEKVSPCRFVNADVPTVLIKSNGFPVHRMHPSAIRQAGASHTQSHERVSWQTGDLRGGGRSSCAAQNGQQHNPHHCQHICSPSTVHHACVLLQQQARTSSHARERRPPAPATYFSFLKHDVM